MRLSLDFLYKFPSPPTRTKFVPGSLFLTKMAYARGMTTQVSYDARSKQAARKLHPDANLICIYFKTMVYFCFCLLNFPFILFWLFIFPRAKDASRLGPGLDCAAGTGFYRTKFRGKVEVAPAAETLVFRFFIRFFWENFATFFFGQLIQPCHVIKLEAETEN